MYYTSTDNCRSARTLNCTTPSLYHHSTVCFYLSHYTSQGNTKPFTTSLVLHSTSPEKTYRRLNYRFGQYNLIRKHYMTICLLVLRWNDSSCNNVAPVKKLMSRQSYNAVPFVTMEQNKSCS